MRYQSMCHLLLRWLWPWLNTSCLLPQQSPDDAVPLGPMPGTVCHAFAQLMDLRMSMPLCRVHACSASRVL